MEPQVRYCTAEDGVRIAYTVTGEGPPLILRIDQLATNVQLEWSQPLFRRVLERIAQTNTLIRYDPRGVGMSDRVYPMTLEEPALDIEAVVERLKLDEFSFAAIQSGTIGVIPYVARHAERVRRFIIVDGYLKNIDLINTPQARAIISAAGGDFDLATETIGTVVFGAGREETLSYGAYIRSCIGPDYFSYAASTAGDDVTQHTVALTMPTLVIRHEGLQYVTAEMTRDLVSRLPDARLVVLPGLWGDDPERLADHVSAFVNDQEYEERDPAARMGANEAAPSGSDGLTPRELEVLRLIAAGRTNSEIATELTLSVRTVARHITHIYEKIGARNKAEATNYSHRNRLT